MADVDKSFERGGIGARGPIKRKARLLAALDSMLVSIQKKIDFIKKPKDFQPRINQMKSDIEYIKGLIEIINEIDVTRMLQGSPPEKPHSLAFNS